ncbi:MAG: hypothetical protein K0R55_2982 [Sporomusa sp.]|nr:hypothetical protein [Sporomusa sp.]
MGITALISAKRVLIIEILSVVVLVLVSVEELVLVSVADYLRYVDRPQKITYTICRMYQNGELYRDWQKIK